MSRVDATAPAFDYAPSFDGVAPSTMEGQHYRAKFDASISSQRGRTRAIDLVLRIFSVVLSVIAFSVMASDSKSSVTPNGYLKVQFSDYDSLKAVLAANVIVCAYSITQALGASIAIVAGHGPLPSPLSEYISFSLDQTFTYLLLATSAAGATAVDLTHDGFKYVWPSICKGTGLSSFCNVAAASISMSFLNFVVVGASAVQSGYYLSKHISRS